MENGMVRFIFSGLILVAMSSLLWLFLSQSSAPAATDESPNQIDPRFCWHLADVREQQLRCLRDAVDSLEGVDLILNTKTQISVLFRLDRSSEARALIESVLANTALFQNADRDMAETLSNIVGYSVYLSLENEEPDLVIWESIVDVSQQIGDENIRHHLLGDLAYLSLLLDRVDEAEALLNLAEDGEQAGSPPHNDNLRGRIARARGEWPEVESIYQEIAQREWRRDSSDGIGEPPLSRIRIMQELEGVDYEHGEPSYPLAIWSEARFFWLEAREAQGICEGWQQALEELEIALSYRLEEVRDVLRLTEEMDRQSGADQTSEHTLIYQRDLAQGLLRRAAVRSRLGLQYFSSQDRRAAEQLIADLTPASRRTIEVPIEPSACISAMD